MVKSLIFNGNNSIKSQELKDLVNSKTKSFWETIAPKEYGFWANVNPKVPHRRWSQEYERDIETAHNAGVISIACTYGYHETDPINWNADHLVQKPSDIMEIV